MSRFFVGAVFLAAGALKCMQPVQAVLATGAYDLLPAGPALAAGLLLPGLEVAVGAALLAGAFRRGAPVLAAVLALAFLVSAGSAWVRGLDIACGCFGPLSIAEHAGWHTVVLDLALLAGSLVLLRDRAMTAQDQSRPS